MKTITFKKLTIKNFLSVGETPVVIDFMTGVNFITGENKDNPESKNAIGKSTIPNALNFVIFGDCLSSLKKDEMSNFLTTGETVVELEFFCDSPRGKNNFIIRRTLNPSGLTVYKDLIDKTRDSIVNTTKYILEVLSATQEIFTNCVLIRSNNNIPFLAKGKVDKKKFIENIFNLDVLTRMNKLIGDDLRVNKQNESIEQKSLEYIDANIKTYQDREARELEDIRRKNKIIVEQRDKKAEEVSKQKQILKDIEESLLKIELPTAEEESELAKEINKVLLLTKKVNELRTTKETELRIARNNLYELNKHSDYCTQCKRKYDDSHIELHKAKIEEVKSNIQKLEAELVKCSETDLKIADKLDNLRDKESKNKRKHKEFTTLTNNKNLAEERVKHALAISDDISLLEEKSSFTEMIVESSASRKKQLEKIKEINDLQTKFNVSQYILSEEGVKSFIIKKLLDLLNFRIKYYLSKLNSQYTLSFDEYFEENIVNQRGIPVSYFNLSGAEGKILDLSTLWAFRDILRLQGSVIYNIVFYDELLDSALDAKHSELVCNILKEFAEKEEQSIYLISHKSDYIKAITGEIIFLQKENGITTRVTA